jgi:hypothetical protein
MKRPARPKSAPRRTSTAQEVHRRKVWASEMIEIAGQTTALPPAEREQARLWASVLSDLARELLSGAPTPTMWDLPRPWV